MQQLFNLPFTSWAAHQRTLLALEREAALEAALSRLRGAAASPSSPPPRAPRLLITGSRAGLFGRTVLSLGPCAGGNALPSGLDLTPGDVAGLRLAGGAAPAPGTGSADLRELYDATGVVTRAGLGVLEVALDEGTGGDGLGIDVGDRVRVDKLADNVTHERLIAALDAAQAVTKSSTAPAARLLSLLFPGPEEEAEAAIREWPRFDMPKSAPGPSTGSRPLNASQEAAVRAALSADDLLLIHGPPGTGKTTTVVEYILREVSRGKKVLAVAPSNMGVDNLLERLAAAGASVGEGVGRRPLTCVRLGHPARISAALLPLSLEARVRSDERSAIVADVRGELETVLRQLRGCRDRTERRELRGVQRQLRAEVRSREEAVVGAILRDADVVLATATGAASRALRRALTPAAGGTCRGFDVVVIDEVAQGLEAACLIPLLLGSKAVLAGDHCQLPPTVLSEPAAAAGLAASLADRVVAIFGGAAPLAAGRDEIVVGNVQSRSAVVHLLDTQYRMHAVIAGWSSARFYGGALVAAPGNAAYRLSDLAHVRLLPHDASTLVPSAVLSNLFTSVQSAADASLRASLRARRKDGEVEGADEEESGDEGGLDATTARAVRVAASDSSLDGGGPPADDLSTLSRGGAFTVANDALDAPLLLIDTAGCSAPEASEGGAAGRGSKANVGEAGIVGRHVAALLAAGVREEEIAVISPYNAQVSLLRAMLARAAPRVDVRSVDGFQGQERAAIILSLVRSNATRTVGFLADFRRINVAVTRAQRHVAIVADSATVSADVHLRSLMRYCEEHGEVRSAEEYLAGGGVGDGSSGAGGSGRPAPLHRSTTTPAASVAVARPTEAEAAAALRARQDAHDAVKRASLRKALRLFVARADDAAARPSPGAAALSFEVPVANLVVRATAVATVTHAADGACCARLVFPSTLNSFERMLVHEIAGEMSLVHASSSSEAAERAPAATDSAGGVAANGGDAGPRAITVTYCPSPPATPPQPSPAEPAAPAVVAPATGNALLRSLHDKRVAMTAAIRQAPATTKSQVGDTPNPAAAAVAAASKARAAKARAAKADASRSSAAPASSGGPTAKLRAVPAALDDDDALLDALVADASRCAAQGCVKPTTVTGTTCAHCRFRLCYEHALPEEHGCGQAARSAARNAHVTATAAGAGGGGKRSSDAWKHDALARQLHKRLDEAAEKRGPKKKE